MADYDGQPGRPTPPAPELSRAQLVADDIDLLAGLNGVAGIVASGRGVVDVLHDVAQFAVRAIPGVDGAGVTMTESRAETLHIQALAVTADFVREIDSVQYHELHEGPCITCMQTRRPAVSGSLGSDERWPRFGGRVARMGVHSALSMPLTIEDQVIGAINAYAHHRDAFAEHAVQLASQFAGPAAVSVCNARLLADARDRAQQLQQALVSRTVIDQAIGIVRARTGVGAEEAFDRLTKISQSENVKLRVVAERLVEEAVRRARVRQRS
ncbi:MAG TPA: GAF and ANTAR domain-containing protein [Mycobacterium sp.]|nr:GAF and ANTAR domain-containing protein [Mycobacterium sp.]